MFGNSNALTAYGTGDTVNVAGTGDAIGANSSGDSIDGSGEGIYLSGGASASQIRTLTVQGNSDVTNAAGNDTLAVNGGSDKTYLAAGDTASASAVSGKTGPPALSTAQTAMIESAAQARIGAMIQAIASFGTLSSSLQTGIQASLNELHEPVLAAASTPHRQPCHKRPGAKLPAKL